jgi:hypothetical protein
MRSDKECDPPSEVSPLNRFKKSMEIDYEKWHDGVGYDVEAIHKSSPQERIEIEKLLINRTPIDWRDIEALSELKSRSGHNVLKAAFLDGSITIRLAVIRYSPGLVDDAGRVTTLIQALRSATLYAGLSQALDLVEEFHPPEVVQELLFGLLKREGDVATLFAAMLFFIYGKAESSFDMKKRPFYLRFNTEDAEKRRLAFLELCNVIGIEGKKYLTA